jgi:hypothetical protein
MSDVGRSVKEGAGFGLVAGVIFATAQIGATWAMGDSPLVPFRRVAGVLIGPSAFDTTSVATVVVVGTIGHMYLSALYGLLYGIYNSALTPATRSSVPRQALLGPLYGTLLWLANSYLFVPYYYPWLVTGSHLPQLVLHVLAYGLPLGLLYGSAEHHVERTSRDAHPA